MSTPPLDTLTLPNVIETLDYETALAALIADARARLNAAGIAWDVDTLETDPIMILLEAWAYRELLLRARVNDAARANLLAFAAGSDLDHLAAFYDVARLADETDDRLRARTRLTIMGRSAGGPDERYRAVVLGVSTRIRDVAIWREVTDPTVRVSVLTTEGDGEADAALLAAVQTALERPDIRVVSDRFVVSSAVQQAVDVTMTVRLEATASASILTDLPDLIAADWLTESLLGLDLTHSWLIAHAMRSGVTRVEVVSPVSDIEVDSTRAIALGTITIIDGGRGR
ncbi:baseplate J/gp47 family protein [Breoghania sp.]|uniref:baseplate assembly protein n=1 Tax=Breoghania sp. TaxID=2065378 RepID=UPI0029CA95B1|nr:baseplate J/gp47 family protein [Breoghania sp.]